MTAPQPRTTVVLADDHALFRSGLARAIRQRPDLELVGEASDGQAALDLIRKAQPAVALLDQRMPELDGLAVVNALHRDGIATAVLILSAHVDDNLASRTAAAGARSCLSKEAGRTEICDAIAAAGDQRSDGRNQPASG